MTIKNDTVPLPVPSIMTARVEKPVGSLKIFKRIPVDFFDVNPLNEFTPVVQRQILDAAKEVLMSWPHP